MKSILKAKIYFEKGMNFFLQEKYKESENEFKLALYESPNRISILSNLALSQIKQKKYKESYINFEKIINLDPHNFDQVIQIINIYYDNKYLLFNDLLIKKFLEKNKKNIDGLLFYANMLDQNNRLLEAYDVYCNILLIDPINNVVLKNIGPILNDLKRHEEALQAHEQALKLNPNYAEGWSNKGVTLNDLKRHEEALQAHEQALKLNPNYAEGWSNKGVTLNDLKRHEEALQAHEQALKLNPNYAEGWSNKGVTLNDLKRHEEALQAHEQALKLNPNYAEGWSNKGVTLNDLKRHEEALQAHEQALKLNPNYAEGWSNKGVTLNDLKRHEEALQAHEQALKLNPNYAEGWSNKGVTLNDLKRHEEALQAHEQALKLNPNYAEGWSNKGVTLNDLKRHEEALQAHEQALKLNPNYAEGFYNTGLVLKAMGNQAKSKEYFSLAYKIKKTINYLNSFIYSIARETCDWSELKLLEKDIIEKINIKKIPFTCVTVIEEDNKLLEIAKNYTNDVFTIKTHYLENLKNYNHKKIRLGYFSSDLREHAVSYLIAELIELHDRTQFEVYAFSFDPGRIGDTMRPRLMDAFDHWHDVQSLSDIEVAKLARTLEIDIAINLNGHTQGARNDIFAYRAAPIQINYLGYPGTMGADYMDYILADRIVIPEENQKYYSEKVLYLPDCYQANDTKRPIAEEIPTRAECGLPETGFVFACFNASYKITPEVFDSWMRILSAVEGSVLWILAEDDEARKNLQQEAEKRQINKKRIKFMERVNTKKHIARQKLADLFLDTSPYNAHTTASDALLVGLPILTKIGKTFPARVSASLLTAIGLEELITKSSEEYEKKAIELAQDPKKLQEIKAKLLQNKETYPLFNTRRFTKNIECLYVEIKK